MMETSWTCVANGFRTVCSSRLSDRDWTLAVSASVVAVLGVGLLVWRMINETRARLERVRVLTDSVLMIEAVRAGRSKASDPSAEDLDAVAEEEKAREATGSTRRVVFSASGLLDNRFALVQYFEGGQLLQVRECRHSMSASEVASYRALVRSAVAQ